MTNVLTIYRREMRSYFTSPIAYIFIVVFLVLMAVYFFFIARFFKSDNPDLRDYFIMLPFAFALLIPAVTMRLWSEEKKSGTVEILMTLPLRSWEVVLAKYLAAYTVIAIAILLTLSVPLSVSLVLKLDWGSVIASYVGAFLLAALYAAIGAWLSALTVNQIVALLASIVLFFVLWGIGLPMVMENVNSYLGAAIGNAIGWFGTFYHYHDFAKGLLRLVHFVYALSLTAFFLILNNFAVEWRKF